MLCSRECQQTGYISKKRKHQIKTDYARKPTMKDLGDNGRGSSIHLGSGIIRLVTRMKVKWISYFQKKISYTLLTFAKPLADLESLELPTVHLHAQINVASHNSIVPARNPSRSTTNIGKYLEPEDSQTVAEVAIPCWGLIASFLPVNTLPNLTRLSLIEDGFRGFTTTTGCCSSLNSTGNSMSCHESTACIGAARFPLDVLSLLPSPSLFPSPVSFSLNLPKSLCMRNSPTIHSLGFMWPLFGWKITKRSPRLRQFWSAEAFIWSMRWDFWLL